jgi:glycosyltransferase involved in cell wall biosynthesis
MALLKNPRGRLVEVEGQERIEYLITHKDFLVATEEEQREFYRERNRPILDTNGRGIFFRKNSENPHGYGQSTKPLIEALEDAGIPVSNVYTGQEVGIVYSYPHPIESLQTKKKVLYSMFESTMIDPAWIPYLKKTDKIFVPSHFCQEAFASRGIETEVIPLGYNPTNFFYKEKQDDGIFTFSMYNAFDQRKGWDILFGAFVEEFGKQEDVKLILKTVVNKLPFPILRSEYPNVEIITGSVPQQNLRDLLYKTDCFVFPSRGEGFGLTPLEALACGTTSIIPNASGMSEYFDDRYFIELQVEGMRAPIYENFDISVVGEMVEPSKKDLRKKMRWAYEHRTKCWEMGYQGSQWVKENYTIKRTGVLLANKLRQIGDVDSEVQEDIVIRNPKSTRKSIAFFLKNRDIYSGGRIFCYQIIHALGKLGYDITLYTNMKPPFEHDMKWCECYKTVTIKSVENVIVDADIYMGAVKEGNIACIRNATRTNKEGYCFVFDPVPVIEKYDDSRTDHEKDWYFEVDKLIQANPKINIVLLTEFAKEVCKDYFRDNPKFILQPCVNDLLADRYTNEREDIIVASSTTSEREKGFEKSLKVFSLTPNNWTYHIFTSSHGSRLPELIQKYHLEGRVIPHYDQGDEKKFEIYSKAKIMFCASPYEGYGMWLAEGRYMGLECVVIENGIFKEISKGDSHIHLAERDNDLDLGLKLNEALQVKKFIKRREDFSFNNLVSNLNAVLECQK